MLDYICRPLGAFLKFIYDTVAFSNYGLAIIVFTIIVRVALIPLTLKQYKSTAQMQAIQPQLEEIKKRYKDDKEKLNEETMKVYQENKVNPAGGCLPMLIQMPIILSLYWVIAQPLKFMLGKSEEAITKIVEVAASGMGRTLQQMGTQKEMVAMNYFHDNQEALSQVSGLLDKSELINFNNFLGLHLGEVASYKPEVLFGPNASIYIPLFILVIAATGITFLSTKLSMPKKKANEQKSDAPGCSNNSMMLMGPVMTLLFGFKLPAGVVLYWMIGYVVGIFQQLYINKNILNKKDTDDGKKIPGKNATDAAKELEAGADGNVPGNNDDGGTDSKPTTDEGVTDNKKLGDVPKGGQKGGKKGKRGNQNKKNTQNKSDYQGRKKK